MATREELAFALATLMDGVKEHDLPNMLGLDSNTCKRLFDIAKEAQSEVSMYPDGFFELKPDYSGYIEVFHFEGSRFARIKRDLDCTYAWYVWDDLNDEFENLDNTKFAGSNLPKRLESLYQDRVMATWD